MNDANPNILAVDDEDFNLKLLIRHLNKEGFSDVAMAGNGVEALDALRENSFDLVLMDIEMPKLNGIETLKRYLWVNNETKVIAITNYEDRLYLTELIGAGFKGCVLKKTIINKWALGKEKKIQGKICFLKIITIIIINITTLPTTPKKQTSILKRNYFIIYPTIIFSYFRKRNN